MDPKIPENANNRTLPSRGLRQGPKTKHEDKIYGLILLHGPISPAGLVNLCRDIRLTDHKIKTCLERLDLMGKIAFKKDVFGTTVTANY